MKIATVGLDVAKQVFQVHAADVEGRVVLRRGLRRNQGIAEPPTNRVEELLPCNLAKALAESSSHAA